MAPDATDLLDLTYRADLGVLIGRWTRQPEPAELPAAYQQLRAVTVSCGATRWLQDIRRRSLNDPATTEWLVTEYFPGLAAQLGRPLRVAYLVGPDLHARIAAHPAMHDPVGDFRIGLFGEEGAAMDWLLVEEAAR